MKNQIPSLFLFKKRSFRGRFMAFGDLWLFLYPGFALFLAWLTSPSVSGLSLASSFRQNIQKSFPSIFLQLLCHFLSQLLSVSNQCQHLSTMVFAFVYAFVKKSDIFLSVFFDRSKLFFSIFGTDQNLIDGINSQIRYLFDQQTPIGKQ